MQKIKRIHTYVWISLFLFILTFSGFTEEEIRMPGFGVQPIRVDEDFSAKILLQKTLGNLRYKLTPGDTFKIVVVIDEPFTQNLILDDTYSLEIPFIGTMNVKDRYFSDLRQEIIKNIKAERVVDFVDFVLVAPAVFDVFIYGGVENPGYATVTPINTLWEAIVMAKGFKKGGSYRTIEMTRKDKTTLYDLTKFVLDGDTTQNPRLEPGDKIYVPHAEIITEIKGKVMYPDFFELVPGETLADLIHLAGGFMPDADTTRIEVGRLREDGFVNFEYVNNEDADTYLIEHGDVVEVKSTMANKPMITVEGAVNGKPSTGTEPRKIQDQLAVFEIPYIHGMSLLQLLDILGGPSPLAAGEESFVIRYTTREKVRVNAKELWETRNRDLDVELEPRDHVVIPIRNIMVLVGGEVNRPGAFPFFNNTIVSDYLKLAGGIDFEKADPNGLYFIDDLGNKTRVSLDTEMIPGAVLYVDRSFLEKTTFVVGKVGIIVGLIASLVAITVNAAEIYNYLR